MVFAAALACGFLAWGIGQPILLGYVVAGQIGEFSFILAQVSLRAGLITPAIYNATLVASLVTILANATLFKIFVKKAPAQVKAVAIA
jgi:predicted Kef-type K+ transport protein